MSERTSYTTVTFRRPFLLKGVDTAIGSGTYEIQTNEEAIEGTSVSGYRRISTTITLQGPTALSRQLVTIDPLDLATALARDQNDQTAS